MQVFRRNALPAVLVPDAIYLIDAGGGFLEFYATGNTNVARRIIDEAEVLRLISENGGGGGGAVAWGGITGTISAQADLAAALAAKQPAATVLSDTTAAFTTAQQSKLAGIATGATVNAADAALRDRATHTGTQLASTISDFAAAVGALGGGGMIGVPTFIQATAPAIAGPYVWWDTSGGDITCWIEDGL